MNTGEPLAVNHMLDGRYRISKMLGQGGMGRVYLANDTRLADRPVACKEMVIGDGIQEQKAVEDFNREARVLASLSHPAIPQVIDYFGERGRHYLVMEYVAGGDLQHQLDKIGIGARLPEAKVVWWARQILDVLQFLHAQTPPIVYRDLKPGNIMIDHHGRAMLVDFGIARFLPPGGRGTQIGSVGYAPPEQYLGKMEPRSDLYSLAATMHHLLTGRDPQLEPPFSFPPLRSLAPQVSLQTDKVVTQALEKDLEKRPGSAREMRDLLPNPSSEEAGIAGTARASSGGIASSRSGAAPMAAMATIVLNRPVAAPSASKPAPAARPGAGAQLETQRSLTLPPVLTPASNNQRSQPPRKAPPPPPATPKRPQSPPAVPKAAPAFSPVSPTAKTKDLGLKRAPSAQSRSTPARTVTPPAEPVSSPSTSPRHASPITAPDPRPGAAASAELNPMRRPITPGVHPALQQPAPASSARRNGHVTAAGAISGPRLEALAEGARFAIEGVRAVIGRSLGPADAIDIDLSRLKRGIDRVSRRHAEIICRGTDYFIRDLGSLNGTYIAGRGRLGRDQLYQLKDRDEVVLGGAKLEFRKG